jgi:hypothetical protein
MYAIPASRYTAARAFTYGATESLVSVTIPNLLTAARWGVLAYDFLSSPEARATYKWVGGMTVALGQLAFGSVVWAYAKTAAWAEAEVQGCMAAEVAAAEVADPFEQPQALAAIPAAMAPVTTLVVKVEPTDYAAMKTPQLRQLCSQRRIQWRNAHGASKHLSKGEMVAALV